MQKYWILFFSIVTLTISAQAQETKAQKYYHKATVLQEKGKLKKALFLFKKAIEQDSAYVQAYKQRGDVFFVQNQLREALLDYDRAIHFDAHYGDAYKAKAAVYVADGAFSEAEDVLLEALENIPADLSVYQALSELYLNVDLLEESEKVLLAAYAMDPLNVQTLLLMSQLNWVAGKDAEARSYLDQLLEIEPHHVEARKLLAQFYLAQQKSVKTIQIYDQLLKEEITLFPADYLVLAEAYYSLGNYEKAKFTLDFLQALDGYEEDAFFYHGYAKVLFRIKKYPQAYQYLQKAIKVMPGKDERHALLLYDKALVLYYLNQSESAVKNYLWSLYLLPQLSDYEWVRKNDIDVMGNSGLALSHLYTSQQVDSVKIQHYQRNAWISLKENDDELAQINIEKMIELDPENCTGLFFLGMNYFYRQQYQFSLGYFEEALQNCETEKELLVVYIMTANFCQKEAVVSAFLREIFSNLVKQR